MSDPEFDPEVADLYEIIGTRMSVIPVTTLQDLVREIEAYGLTDHDKIEKILRDFVPNDRNLRWNTSQRRWEIDQLSPEDAEATRQYVENFGKSRAAMLSAFLNSEPAGIEPIGETRLWRVDKAILEVEKPPLWLPPSLTIHSILDAKLARGEPLDALSWREFEELVGQLLEDAGWHVEITKPSYDGGIDVIAAIDLAEIGSIRTVWQAKKYNLRRKVQLKEIRELLTATNDFGASKGMIITTSTLTKGAEAYIKQREFRLGKVDRPELESWVNRTLRSR